jgi:Outer membrane protein beta-barrel domain
MNKIFFTFLLFISSLAWSQTVPTDSIATNIVPSIVDTVKIKKPAPLVWDTLSYSAEYKRDKWRMVAGFRGGVSRGKYEIRDGSVDKIGSTGLPVLDENGKIIKGNFVTNSTFSSGFDVGVFARFLRGSFFVQPELIFSSKAGIIDILKNDGGLYKRVYGKFNAIDVPILFGIRSKRARVFFGPVINYGININDEIRNSLLEFTEAEKLGSKFFSKPIMNFNLGIGFEVNSIFIDVRYEKSLASFTNIEVGPSNSSKPFRLFAEGLHISFGYVSK